MCEELLLTGLYLCNSPMEGRWKIVIGGTPLEGRHLRDAIRGSSSAGAVIGEHTSWKECLKKLKNEFSKTETVKKSTRNRIS